jgi:endonuclease/exonuclease/phosphatase family metal-dependent hydrolase
MTMNLLSSEHATWTDRRPVLEHGFDAIAPDVVALQETVSKPGYDQARELLGPGYQVVRHPSPSADGVGAALLSRWPVRLVREVDLHVTERVDLPWSAAVLAEVQVPAPVGAVLFVHCKPTYQQGCSYERELQAVECARAVEAHVGGRDVHVVLLGDLDDGPDSASVRFWTGRQSLRDTSVAYLDAWEAVHPGEPGHTFTPDNPLVRAGEMSLETGRRIDHVMVRCGAHGPTLEVVDCRRAFDEPVGGVWASDHFGVVADLRLPERPPGRWA